MRKYITTAILLIFIAVCAMSQQTREINKTISLEPEGKLIIDTYKGTINITGHDKPVVEINVKIEADDEDFFDSEQNVKDTEIEINSTENTLLLKTNYKKIRHINEDFDFWDWLKEPHISSYSLPLVHYTITMPRTAELKIKDYKSTSIIDGIKSGITFETYKGKVEVVHITGAVDLVTYKGKAQIKFAELRNNSSFKTNKGRIIVELPKETGFELQTDFGRRANFFTDFNVNEKVQNKRKRNYNYFGRVNGGGPLLEFKSNKGDVQLRAKKL